MKRFFGQTSSGRSSSSSSSKSEETKAPSTDAMSTTARLILETLEKMSTPLKDSDKMPTLSVDRKRVAEELNNSLGLTGGSARKRPRLGTGPMQSGSPLGGPPFRKLYSPLSAHRSRPPRVNHITPLATLNNSRPSTPYGIDTSSTGPPPPPNIFSTPLSSMGASGGGGKLRNKVTLTNRGTVDSLENEDPPPPLPAFLTNNVPQLKVSTPMTGFSFATSMPVTITPTPTEKDTKNNNEEKADKTTPKPTTSTENKPMPPITFGLAQPLTTIADQPKKATFGGFQPKSDNTCDEGEKETNKMFSFSSPRKTVLHQKDAASTGSIPAFNKVFPSIVSEAAKPSSLSASISSTAAKVTNGFDTSIVKDKVINTNHLDNSSASKSLTNGLDTRCMVQYTFGKPNSVVADCKTVTVDKQCSMSFTFSPPEIVGKGK